MRGVTRQSAVSVHVIWGQEEEEGRERGGVSSHGEKPTLRQHYAGDVATRHRPPADAGSTPLITSLTRCN